jgi:hypothetical protein
MLRCHFNMHRSLIRLSFRSTFPRPARPTARARPARSTPSTRSPSTRLERLPFSHRESVVTIESSPVTEVRPSLSSTRRVRHSPCFCFCPARERISDNQNSQDHQEGCPAVGVHRVQDQGSAGSEALQALRAWVRHLVPPQFETDADRLTVVTRKPRVLLLFSKRVWSWGKKAFRFCQFYFSLLGKRCHWI